MAAIKIQTTVNEKEVQELIKRLYSVSRTEPNLSPRQEEELHNAYMENNFLFAMDGKTVIGWLLRIPYSPTVQELAFGYVEKRYQRKGILNQLVMKALDLSKITIAVTFQPFLIRWLKRISFTESSLVQVTFLTKGKFISHRLHIFRLLAIKNHYKKNKPKYFLHIKND